MPERIGYTRVRRGDSCYHVTYGPRFVHLTALTGIVWTSPYHTHTYIVPNEDLRPAAEWQAHIRESS